MYINETIQKQYKQYKHNKYKHTYYQNTHTLQSPKKHKPTLSKPTHTHIPTYYKTHTYTHTHTLQNKLKQPQYKIHTKWNSYNSVKYPQYKVNLMYMVLLSLRTRIRITVHEVLCTFFIISRLVLLRIWNVSDRSCRENQNTHFVFNSLCSKIVSFLR